MAPPRRSSSDDEAEILRTLGGKVQEAREAAGLSLAELARRAGMDRAYISRIEAGSHAPTILVLLRIAAELDTTVSALTALDLGAKGAIPDPERERLGSANGELVEAVRAASLAGGSVRVIADELGVSTRTVSEWLQRAEPVK